MTQKNVINEQHHACTELRDQHCSGIKAYGQVEWFQNIWQGILIRSHSRGAACRTICASENCANYCRLLGVSNGVQVWNCPQKSPAYRLATSAIVLSESRKRMMPHMASIYALEHVYNSVRGCLTPPRHKGDTFSVCFPCGPIWKDAVTSMPRWLHASTIHRVRTNSASMTQIRSLFPISLSLDRYIRIFLFTRFPV